MTAYTLSPSLLTFEYNSCKRCFWLQAKKVWKKPPQPFPRIFITIDRCMRECYHYTDARLISSDLPSGIIDTTERTITSAPIQLPGHRSSLTFSGKMDALINFADGTVGIIDFKTTETKDEQLAFYSRQLHAYRHILKYPKIGPAQETSHMGLLCVTPNRMTHGETAVFEMKLTWKPIPINDREWMKFLSQLVQLLDGTEPTTRQCIWCGLQKAQAHFKLANEKFATELISESDS